MAGRPAYERSSTLEDIEALKRRGYATTRIATEMGMARSTVYRILRESATT